jgi:hypothetical protein
MRVLLNHTLQMLLHYSTHKVFTGWLLTTRNSRTSRGCLPSRTLLVWNWTIWYITSVALYRLCTDHAQKNSVLLLRQEYCVVDKSRDSQPVLLGVWRHAPAWKCLPGRNLETDCVTPLFHCWYVYYLETDDSVAQHFLRGANTPQYQLKAHSSSVHNTDTVSKMVCQQKKKLKCDWVQQKYGWKW